MGEVRDAIRSSLERNIAKSGYTQKEFAEALGVSKSSVTNWIRGKNTPDIELLRPICKLLNISLSEFYGEYGSEDEGSRAQDIKKAPSELSESARSIAKDYDKLDKYGKTAVQVILDTEKRRVTELEQQRRERPQWEDEEAGQARVIPLYFTPAAAGYASPAFGEDFEYIEVGGVVPTLADFAVKIDGDSMEPYILDGSTVYVNRDPLADGDVGIFCLDGDMLCKQYRRDEDGDVWLLSLNRERSDADRHIPPDSGSSLTCFGRVMLPEVPKF